VLLEAQDAKKNDKTGLMRKGTRITFVSVEIEMSKRENRYRCPGSTEQFSYPRRECGIRFGGMVAWRINVI
jgi:hypothetical protein